MHLHPCSLVHLTVSRNGVKLQAVEMNIRDALLKNSCEEALYSKSNFEYTSIADLLPPDPFKKHRLVKILMERDFRFPCELLTYSPRSNIWNLQFF